jgi:hypothetical protein
MRDIQPRTAQELLLYQPGISVSRDRLGHMTVRAEAESSFSPQVISLFPTRVEKGINGLGLGISARLPRGPVDTQLTIPVDGGIPEMHMEHRGTLDPDEVVQATAGGVALFGALLELSPEERVTLQSLPHGNGKAEDHMDSAQELQEALAMHGILTDTPSLDAFPVARQIFLTD